MNIYLLLFASLMVVLLVILLCSSRQPLIEPFTRKFFDQIKPTHFVGIDQSQLFSNEFDLIETVRRMMPYNLNTLYIDPSMDRYKHLNDNKIQLVLSRSNEIYDLLYKITPFFAGLDIQNIRFVCTLYTLPVNILTTEMSIDEFGQLKGSKLTVNVGPINSSDYFIAVDLFLKYKIIVGRDVCITHYDVNDLIKHYGQDVQVAIIARTHPDKTVLNLINKKLTRLIEILKYNDGNIYHINLDEHDFYKDYPYYSKMIIEKDKLRDYYPNLVINEQIFAQHSDRPTTDYRSRFINTISIKYYLLSNKMTQRLSINQLLYNMKLNMNTINQLVFIDEDLNTASLVDFTLPMEIHQGAIDFYTNAGLFTNISNPSCIMINGRCDEKQLREHHLDNKFGPTFDQLYNS